MFLHQEGIIISRSAVIAGIFFASFSEKTRIEDFKAYDKKIQGEVTYLMNTLYERYNYTRKGAKEVCIYVIDNDLAGKYGNKPSST